ncbi:CDP-alcohol phosphatidyltransferase family protein, partial [Burkholderia multivorans]
LSLLALVSSIVTAIIVPLGAAPLSGERWLVLILVPLCLLSVIGHFMSIMASKRLS